MVQQYTLTHLQAPRILAMSGGFGLFMAGVAKGDRVAAAAGVARQAQCWLMRRREFGFKPRHHPCSLPRHCTCTSVCSTLCHHARPCGKVEVLYRNDGRAGATRRARSATTRVHRCLRPQRPQNYNIHAQHWNARNNRTNKTKMLWLRGWRRCRRAAAPAGATMPPYRCRVVHRAACG